MSHDHELDALDKMILHALEGDARKPFLEIARECNVSGAAVHQRVQKMAQNGVYKRTEIIIDYHKLGYETCAYIGVSLRDPAQFQNVVDQLMTIDEIVECYFTLGRYDLIIKLYAKNNAHLYDMLGNNFHPLVRTETLVCLKEGFRRTLPVKLDE
jgi:Lrp/AsnC family transcriptional regulator for asnA, asnC and gidA